MSFWRPAHLQSVGWASLLETQAEFLVTLLRQNLFFSGKPEFFALETFNGWDEGPHTMEGNLLYLKSTDYKCQSHLQNAFTAMSRLAYGQIIGTVA